MGFSAKVLADSVSETDCRVTSMEVTFPRIVLAEFNTTRVFSRNSASSRAIPLPKQLLRVLEDPFVPDQFGINQPGMQSAEVLSGGKHAEACEVWLQGRDKAVETAYMLYYGEYAFSKIFGPLPSRRELLEHTKRLTRPATSDEVQVARETARQHLNVHKQLVNRVLEPFMWHTVIVTATEWSNFFALRNHPDAQREIGIIAAMMSEKMMNSRPQFLAHDQWHLPLVMNSLNPLGYDYPEWENNPDPIFWAKVSTARCARVSYLTHDGKRDTSKDLELYERLVKGGHMSPLEHVARPMDKTEFAKKPWSGNFQGWHQFRKDVPDESNFALVRDRATT